MFKYFPLVSLVLLGLLFLTGSPHLWAGSVFFIIQLATMGLIYWVIKKMKEKDIMFLIPIMKQFKGFFAISITGWIILALFGFAADVVGRAYSIGALVVFLGLSSSLTNQLFVTSDLLAPYLDDKQKKKGKDDKHDQRNR